MKAELLLKEIEDALVSASKYADAHHGLIMMTHARARTLIADIRAARSQGRKATRLSGKPNGWY